MGALWAGAAGREGMLASIASTDQNAATLSTGNCLLWIDGVTYSFCGQLSSLLCLVPGVKEPTELTACA